MPLAKTCSSPLTTGTRNVACVTPAPSRRSTPSLVMSSRNSPKSLRARHPASAGPASDEDRRDGQGRTLAVLQSEKEQFARVSALQ